MRLVIALASTTFCLATGRAAAQPARAGVIVGRIVDSASVAVPDAAVQLTAPAARTPIRTARTDADGRFRIAELPSASRYRLLARRVGFVPDTLHDVTIAANDTTRLTIRLRASAAPLPTVTVRGRRADRFYRPFIDSTEIADSDVPRSYLRTALDVVEQLRPIMAGATWKGCPATQNVLINGVRVTGQDIVTSMEVLREIPADDILEMRYTDCWNRAMPGVAGQDAIYVVLKVGRAYRHR